MNTTEIVAGGAAGGPAEAATGAFGEIEAAGEGEGVAGLGEVTIGPSAGRSAWGPGEQAAIAIASTTVAMARTTFTSTNSHRRKSSRRNTAAGNPAASRVLGFYALPAPPARLSRPQSWISTVVPIGAHAYRAPIASAGTWIQPNEW